MIARESISTQVIAYHAEIELTAGQDAINYGREHDAHEHLAAAEALMALFVFEALSIRHNWPLDIDPKLRAMIANLNQQRDTLFQTLLDFPEVME